MITPLSITAATDDLVINGNYLYAPTATGLSIYSIPGTALSSLITGYTAIVQTSNGGGIAYDPASFNVPPTHITSGTGFDTLEWDNPPGRTPPSSLVSRIPVRASSATVDQGGNCQLPPPRLATALSISGPCDIAADQIISITPCHAKTLGPSYFGFPGAPYTLTLRNPTSAALIYSISFAGITNRLAASVSQLPGAFHHGQRSRAGNGAGLPLNLTPPLTLPSATYPFEVIANAPGRHLLRQWRGTLTYYDQYVPPPATPGPGAPGEDQPVQLG